MKYLPSGTRWIILLREVGKLYTDFTSYSYKDIIWNAKVSKNRGYMYRIHELFM